MGCLAAFSLFQPRVLLDTLSRLIRGHVRWKPPSFRFASRRPSRSGAIFAVNLLEGWGGDAWYLVLVETSWIRRGFDIYELGFGLALSPTTHHRLKQRGSHRITRCVCTILGYLGKGKGRGITAMGELYTRLVGWPLDLKRLRARAAHVHQLGNCSDRCDAVAIFVH